MSRNPDERRKSERVPIFRAASIWVFLDGDWSQFDVRLYDESAGGVRMRVRQDVRDYAILLRDSSNPDTLVRCRIASCNQMARDCWEYGVELGEVVSPSDKIVPADARPKSVSIADEGLNQTVETPMREERFAASNQRAELRYQQADAGQTVSLINFSASGAGFLMHAVPRVGEGIVLSIYEPTETFEFEAIIRWAEPVGSGAWKVGCKFEESTLNFGRHGDKNNRSTCQVPVNIRQQDRQVGSPARVLNHSENGVGIETNSQLSPGDRLMVQGDASHFFVRVQWAVQKDGLTRAGGKFLCVSDREGFEALITPSAEPVTLCSEQPVPQPERSSDRHLWAACLFIYGWTGLYLSGGWPV